MIRTLLTTLALIALVIPAQESQGASYIELVRVAANVTTHITGTVPAGRQCFIGKAYNSAPEGQNDSAPSDEACVNVEEGNTLTIRWTAPTRNTDGTTLTDLTGFRLFIRDWTVRPATYQLILTVE